METLQGSALRAKLVPTGRSLSNHMRVTDKTRQITPPRLELLHAALWVYVRGYMSEGPKITEKEQRERRLQAALRENLKRRKAQARGRADKGDAEPHDSAGIAADKDNG
jgi:hypothetical protein